MPDPIKPRDIKDVESRAQPVPFRRPVARLLKREGIRDDTGHDLEAARPHRCKVGVQIPVGELIVGAVGAGSDGFAGSILGDSILGGSILTVSTFTGSGGAAVGGALAVAPGCSPST